MPAVPPYSSATTAICRPRSRSWSSRSSSGIDPGTIGTGTVSCSTSTVERSAGGMATARLRCTRPMTSSESSPDTGNRE